MSLNPFGNSVLNQGAGLNSIPTWMSSGSTASSADETAQASAVDLSAVIQAFQDSMQSTQSSGSVGQSVASYTPESLASQMQEIRITDEHKSSGFKFATTSYMGITPGTMKPFWG